MAENPGNRQNIQKHNPVFPTNMIQYMIQACCALLLVVMHLTTTNARRWVPPRNELAVSVGDATLISALTYPCEDDDKKLCQGIPHQEALFGVTTYGERKVLHLYDGTPHPGATGCPPVTYATDKFQKPFVLLINRGVCKFTEKVRAAEAAGADSVIIVDNVAMANEPLCVCPDFKIPTNTNGKHCTAANHAADCTCPGNGVCLPISTTPSCGAGVFPSYQNSCDSATISGPCWKCGELDYYKSDCNANDDRTHCMAHHYLPFMADDGYGGDITVPSVLISDYYGSMLRMDLKKRNNKMTMKMEWNLPLLDTSTLELWTSCEDNAGSEFKLDFKETYLRLQPHLNFQPRYYIFDGKKLKCDKKYDCGTQCISNGLYCGRDPDGAMNVGIDGKDIVMENLRQMCIWNVLGKVGNANPLIPDDFCSGNACATGWVNKNTNTCASTGKVLECWNTDLVYQCCGDTLQKEGPALMKWWCYVNDFSNKCFDESGTVMENGENFEKCANDVMVLHDIDIVKVQRYGQLCCLCCLCFLGCVLFQNSVFIGCFLVLFFFFSRIHASLLLVVWTLHLWTKVKHRKQILCWQLK